MNAAVATTIAPADHDRRKLIGGSDVAAILGISPWKTPLDVYLDKIKPRSDQPDQNKARVFSRGKRMEPYVIDLLAEETGSTIIARGKRYRDPEFDFMAAEIDAETDKYENVEIKTVSPFKAKEWGEQQSDEVPVHYTAQVMHGLMVTGRSVCIFGVLIGADDFRVYRVERDDETIDAMRQKEIEFWDRIERRIPPDPATTGDILTLFERDSGAVINADDTTIKAIYRMQELKEQIGPLEKEFERLKQNVQVFMRDAAVLAVGGITLATWKTQVSNRFDQKAFGEAHPLLLEQFKHASESRVFRLK